MKWIENDGGRAAAGFKGDAGDCVCRAIAIASGRPYRDVYEKLAQGNATQRITKRMGKTRRGVATAREGISVGRKWYKEYMNELGFEWVSCMGFVVVGDKKIGTGCQVHLRADELPQGRLVVHVSKHAVAVIDGIIHDTHDPSRNGTRCVYGYWKMRDE